MASSFVLYGALEYWTVIFRICKRLRSPGIDSEESIPPAFVAWWAGKPKRDVVPVWESIPGLLKRFTNTGSENLTIRTEDLSKTEITTYLLNKIIGIFTMW
jgi:hypothetical protein